MRPSSKQWTALGALCLSLLIVTIDNSILNVAIPTLVRQLGAQPAQLQWIVDAYTLVFAGLLLTSGSLGDRFGRRRVLTIGLVVFGTSSLGASLATTPTELIVWRGIMGVGGAMIMPATLSILVNVFTEERSRRRAIAYWSLMNATGSFVGPVAGGILLRHFWWGSCFFVNVPIVAVTLTVQRFVLPESRNPEKARFDVAGAALSTASLAFLLWGIIEGPTQGWSSPVILGALGLSILTMFAFVRWERRATSPMIDLSIFRNAHLSAAAAAMTIAFIAMTGSVFLITQNLQIVKGYSPLVAALAVSVPVATVNFLLMPRSPALTERFGARWMIATGTGLIGVSLLVISLTTVHSGYANVLVGFAIMAIGFSIFVPASTDAIMTAVPKEAAGGPSAINQSSRQIGQALGIAIAGSIAAVGYRGAFSATGLHLTTAQLKAADSSIAGALDVSRALPERLQSGLLAVAHQALLDGSRVALIAAAALAGGGALLAALAIPARRLRAAREPTAPMAAGSDSAP